MQSAKGFLVKLQEYLLNFGHHCQERNFRKFANMQIKPTRTLLLAVTFLKELNQLQLNALQKKK